MGRRKIGSKPYTTFDNGGIATLRTTIAGRKVRVSLGTAWTVERRGSSKIEALAAQKYAELAAGRVTAPDARIATSHTLEELIALWLVDVERLYPVTHETFEIHSRTILEYSDSIVRMMSDDGPNRYALHRLGMVLRTTVRKELCSLFGFYTWAKSHGHILSIPTRPVLPKGFV